MTKHIIAVWAEDEKGLIGREDQLPWRLPKEWQHFKETTMDHSILMGRVTFEGMQKRLLPGRQTIILTTDKSYRVEDALVFHSIQEVLAWYQSQDKNLYVIGGAQVFEAFDAFYDQAIRTVVHGQFEGDTYFPDGVCSAFSEKSSRFFAKDDKNAYDFTIHYLEK